MKATLILFILTLLNISIAISQEQGEFRIYSSVNRTQNTAVGEGLVFKTGTGATLGVEYFILSNISIAPSYTHVFETVDYSIGSGFSNRRSVKARTTNIDGRYYLSTEELFGVDLPVQLYGLAGFCSYFQKIVQSGVGNADYSNGIYTEKGVGFNLGIGIVVPIDNVTITSQYKYQSAFKGRTAFDIGIGFNLSY